MSKVLQTATRSIKSLLERSQISYFFSWWKDELLACLPERWRERLSSAPARIVLFQSTSGQWHAARVRGNKNEAQRDLDLNDPSSVRRALGFLEALNDRPAEIKVLAFAPEKVMLKRLTLPLAAEENLTQVLEFEMDRQTPFKADQIYFDCRVIKRDTAQRQLLVDLLAVPRQHIDTALSALAPAQISLDGVDAGRLRGAHFVESLQGFNLLPPEKRASSGDPQARLRWILFFSLIGLIGLALKQSLDARTAALLAMQEELSKTQNNALATAALARKLREEIDGANFLIDRKERRPETVKVLLELTQRIPDTTWLERISFVGDAVQLQGQSASADKLIGLLQKAVYVRNPQQQGVIQPDPGTGKERFSLQLDLREESAAPEAELKGVTAKPVQGAQR